MRLRQVLTGSSAASTSKSLIARPLEGAKDHVIGIGRGAPRHEILPLDGAAQRVEAGAEGWQPRFPVAHDIFEGGAKAFLARAAEIGLILRRAVTMDVEHDETDQPGLQYRFGPVLHEALQRPPSCAAEQRRPVGIALLEVIGYRRRIMDDPIAINDDRYPARIWLRQLVLFREAQGTLSTASPLWASAILVRQQKGQLGDWFWNNTAAGASIIALRAIGLASADERLNAILGNFMVPAARVALMS
jgi:hypothetical protein